MPFTLNKLGRKLGWEKSARRDETARDIHLVGLPTAASRPPDPSHELQHRLSGLRELAGRHGGSADHAAVHDWNHSQVERSGQDTYCRLECNLTLP